MKNIYEVLRQKELELQQVQREIEALRVAARLLADDAEAEVPAPKVVVKAAPPASAAKPAEAALGAASGGIRQFP